MVRKIPRLLAALAVVVLIAGVVAPAHAVAPTFSLQQTFTEPGVSEFGTSVSCLDEWAVAGGKGKAIVYHKVDNTWSRFAELVSPDPSPIADGFGMCVDMDDGIVVVGAPDYNGGQGAAYVFIYSSSQGQWHLNQKLVADTPVTGERFGSAVSVDGNIVVVGAPGQSGDDDQLTESAVYVFTQGTTWAQTQKIEGPSNLPSHDWFGHEVCVHGGSDQSVKTLIVGAPKYDNRAGAAYVYRLTGGQFGDMQELRIFDGTSETYSPASGNHFGCAVAVRGSTIIVGAPGANSSTGGGYVFVYNSTSQQWVTQEELTEPTPAGDFFGYSVALCTDVALVGAPDSLGSGSGTASFFRRSGVTWGYASDVQLGAGKSAGDRYGYCVDTYCTVAMVGAPQDNGGTGTVYFHTTCKPTPVYRFYNPRAGTHFYTDNKAERDHVWQNLSRYYAYEGTVYMTNAANNTHPLFRFYNVRNGSHFYTADENEKANVLATLGGIYQYDGPTYYVSLNDGGEGKTTVYRFYNLRNGSHFYTADPNEKASVIANLGAYYKYEGIAFYLGQ